MPTTAAQRTEYTTRRFDVILPQPYDDAVRRYEQLVPTVDFTRFGVLGTWDAVKEQAEINAPYGFMIYWKVDVTSVMAASPSNWKCSEYLMGNHVIAERMFHHEPAAMLHAPLRTVIYADIPGRTHLVVDQPSSHFGSYDHPGVAEVGLLLDRKLGDLLERLGAEVPEALKSTEPV
jgi:hypothetical protein